MPGKSPPSENNTHGLDSRRDIFHDRVLIIDDIDFFHFGASVKNAGHRTFMFSKLEEAAVIEAIRQQFAREWARGTVEIE
jgi:hypothetical protein